VTGGEAVWRPRDLGRTRVFTVHAVKLGEVGAVEIVLDDERTACAYARDRSRDFRVLSASVTRFTLGELGTRHRVAWYVDGVEQPRLHDRQLYPADGSGHGTLHRRPRAHPGPGRVQDAG
jgi:hypothetical protein